MEEAYNTQVLPNGVRIVTEHVPSVRSASLGIWVGTGSRSEKPGEGGAPPGSSPRRWTPSAAR